MTLEQFNRSIGRITNIRWDYRDDRSAANDRRSYTWIGDRLLYESDNNSIWYQGATGSWLKINPVLTKPTEEQECVLPSFDDLI